MQLTANMAGPLTVHACCVAIKGRGVLISGPSGSGKSDLALRLIDRGALLVSDDYTDIQPHEEGLCGAPPKNLAGKIEVRGIGILEVPHLPRVPICLIVALDRTAERFPLELEYQHMAERVIPVLPLSAFEASAPIKVELMLQKLDCQ